MMQNVKYYQIWGAPNTIPNNSNPYGTEPYTSTIRTIEPNLYPTIEPIYSPSIILNSFYSLNDKNVKLELINGKIIKGKIVNQTAWVTNLIEIVSVYKNKERTKFIPFEKIISIELI